MFYEVMPGVRYRSGGGALTYQSDQMLVPGQIVQIPLGRRLVTGVIEKKVPSVDFPTKKNCAVASSPALAGIFAV